MKGIKGRSCVFLNCDRKAISRCDSCGIPICESHSRRMDKSILCVSCFEYIKKLKLRQAPSFDIN